MVPPAPFANATTVLKTLRFSSRVSGSFSLYSRCSPSPWVARRLRSAARSRGRSNSISELRYPPQGERPEVQPFRPVLQPQPRVRWQAVRKRNHSVRIVDIDESPVLLAVQLKIRAAGPRPGEPDVERCRPHANPANARAAIDDTNPGASKLGIADTGDDIPPVEEGVERGGKRRERRRSGNANEILLRSVDAGGVGEAERIRERRPWQRDAAVLREAGDMNSRQHLLSDELDRRAHAPMSSVCAPPSSNAATRFAALRPAMKAHCL